MSNLSKLIEDWENSSLEFRQAERLISLLIIDNDRLDLSETELIQERDFWLSKATELAQDIGHALGFEVGEHTSSNCPIQAAIDGIAEMKSQIQAWKDA